VSPACTADCVNPLATAQRRWAGAGGRLRIGECFAGAGGLSLGLAAAGHELVFAVESVATFSRTYLRAHPRTRLFREPMAAVRLPALPKPVAALSGDRGHEEGVSLANFEHSRSARLGTDAGEDQGREEGLPARWRYRPALWRLALPDLLPGQPSVLTALGRGGGAGAGGRGDLRDADATASALGRVTTPEGGLH
jgi:hypothetical protein